jgi:NADH dehydrogenase
MHLVSLLCQQGFDVRCLVRRSAESIELDQLRSCGAKVFADNLSELSSSSIPAFQGADTAVNLIGSVAPARGESFSELHLGNTRTLAGECILHKVPRIVMVSALGTADGAKSAYHASKWAAEQFLRGCGLKSVIIRPSLIVGRQTGNRDSKLVKRYCELIKERKEVPLIAGGANRLQPVFIGDLCEAVAAVVATNAYDGRLLEIGGPEVVTMLQLVTSLMTVLGIEKPIKDIPVPLARIIAFGCQLVQKVPLLSEDQVTLATEDLICRENRLEVLTGSRGTPLSFALRAYAPH